MVIIVRLRTSSSLNLKQSLVLVKAKAIDTVRLLLCEGNLEPPLFLYLACTETFTLWQQSTQPLYYELSLQERVRIAIWVSHSALWKTKSGAFRAALTRDIFPTPAVSMRASESRTLLHAVMVNTGGNRQR